MTVYQVLSTKDCGLIRHTTETFIFAAPELQNRCFGLGTDNKPKCPK